MIGIEWWEGGHVEKGYLYGESRNEWYQWCGKYWSNRSRISEETSVDESLVKADDTEVETAVDDEMDDAAKEGADIGTVKDGLALSFVSRILY